MATTRVKVGSWSPSGRIYTRLPSLEATKDRTFLQEFFAVPIPQDPSMVFIVSNSNKKGWRRRGLAEGVISQRYPKIHVPPQIVFPDITHTYIFMICILFSRPCKQQANLHLAPSPVPHPSTYPYSSVLFTGMTPDGDGPPIIYPMPGSAVFSTRLLAV